MELNEIYKEENLKFLKQLPREFFDLIYIDPPFFTQKSHQDFNDQWESLGHYLDFMNMRLKHIHRVLKQTGSLYVHLDWHASHFVKILLDKIFGCENFRNEIIWKRTLVSKQNSRRLGVNNDYILFYTKSEDYLFNLPVKPLTREQIERDYQKEEETGRYFTHSKLWGYYERNPRKALYFPDIKKRVESPEGYGFYWTQSYLDKKFEANSNCIYWTKNGTPRNKVYLDEHEGVPLDNLWLDINPLSSNSKEYIYRTQKPEALLKRIIKISSERGDLVGDFFAGSGTTLVVAKKLKRNYLGCDHNPPAIDLIRKRLKEVDVYATITDFSQPERKKQLNEKKKKQHANLTTWLKK